MERLPFQPQTMCSKEPSIAFAHEFAKSPIICAAGSWVLPSISPTLFIEFREDQRNERTSGPDFRVIAVCTSVRPNKLSQRTSEWLLQSSKHVFRTTIIHVPLPTSVHANPKVLTNETSPSHSPNIESNHPKAYTVAPATTVIKSTTLTKESKRAHDESTPTTSSNGNGMKQFLLVVS